MKYLFKKQKRMSKEKHVEVLVVDDNLGAAKSFAELIEASLQIRTLPESDPEVVLEKVRNENIRVVVLDQRMPKISGTELYKKIYSINPFIRAIMLTGEADRKEVADAINNLKYVGFLEKSEIDSLQSKVIEAYAKYENEVARDSIAKKHLWVLNPFKNRFYTMRYDICSIKQVNKHYIFPDRWQTRFTLDCDEKEEEETIEFEDEIIISSDIELKDTFSSTLNILPTFKSGIDTAISQQYGLKTKVNRKKKKVERKKYRLQDNAETGKTVEKKVYETAPVYMEFQLLVKKQCRICGQCEMIPVTAYKSAMKEATRVTIYYNDSTSNTIDTGDVSV